MKNNKSNIGNLLTTEESAKYSGLKMQSFRNLVSRHIGPKLDHKEGLRCYYHKKELDRWNMIRLKRAPLAKKKVSPKEMIKIAVARKPREAATEDQKAPIDEIFRAQIEMGRYQFISINLAILEDQLKKRKSYYIGSKQDGELLKSITVILALIVQELLKQRK
jgi:hypothetical protein